jgi:hypothetical protein
MAAWRRARTPVKVVFRLPPILRMNGMPSGSTASAAATPRTSREWSLPTSLAAIAVGMPALFWLQFGVIDEFAYGLAGFLVLLVLAVHFLPRKTGEFAADLAAHEVERGRFDFLGVVWLLSVPFAPFLSWILTSAFELTPASWRPLLGARAFLCVVVPCVCVLPLVRYVRGKAATFMTAVLVLGTTFPVLCGLDAAIDSIRGPEWENVQIVRVRDVDFTTRAGTHVHVEGAFAELAEFRLHPRDPVVAAGSGLATVPPRPQDKL